MEEEEVDGLGGGGAVAAAADGAGGCVGSDVAEDDVEVTGAGGGAGTCLTFSDFICQFPTPDYGRTEWEENK